MSAAGVACCSTCATTGGSCRTPKAAALGDLSSDQIAALRRKVAPLSVSYEPLAPGSLGLSQIVPKMEIEVAKAIIDPRVRRAAEWITQGARAGDRMQEARAIYEFVAERVKFLRDPTDVQLLLDPITALSRIDRFGWAATNCAGHSMLTATLGHEIRLPIVWVLAGPAPSDPQHVYAAMRLDGLDANAPVADVTGDLLSLDTGQPWNHVPAFGKHVDAASLRVVPALRGL